MEVTLSPEEKSIFENEAIIYSIIRTLEPLEKAYLNEKISEDEYHTLCKRLINQYKTISDSLDQSYPGLLPFMQKYQLDTSCRLALKRLQVGMTAAEIHGGSDAPQMSVIINATQSLITANNALQLNITTVDQLQPLIQEVVTCLGRVKGVPASFTGSAKMQDWLRTLSSMRAYDSLSEEQGRQLEFDIDQAYRDFKQCMDRS
ncbi:unnamed protein product [Blepharisma stoltei]|uniref:Vacuolar protein sorting-associated protein 28 homolog n=1 Tax=Blepharisma stoltei TaxID=1481888 RepID=A0AAU9J5T1_9CILI|nr:unnamed protein product [Blepharisma stoltei]